MTAPDVIGEGHVHCPCGEFTLSPLTTYEWGWMGPGWLRLLRQVRCPNCGTLLELLERGSV